MTKEEVLSSLRSQEGINIDSLNQALNFISSEAEEEYPFAIKYSNGKVVFAYHDGEMFTQRTFDKNGFTDEVDFV